METLIPLVVGAIITALTQYSKKHNISSRVTLAFSVIIAALIYTAFQNFLDPHTQEKIIAFVTSTAGSAVLFYEYGFRILKGETAIDPTIDIPAPTPEDLPATSTPIAEVSSVQPGDSIA